MDDDEQRYREIREAHTQAVLKHGPGQRGSLMEERGVLLRLLHERDRTIRRLRWEMAQSPKGEEAAPADAELAGIAEGVLALTRRLAALVERDPAQRSAAFQAHVGWDCG